MPWPMLASWSAHLTRLAISRADCTATISSATRTAMMAVTTSISISEKPTRPATGQRSRRIESPRSKSPSRPGHRVPLISLAAQPEQNVGPRVAPGVLGNFFPQRGLGVVAGGQQFVVAGVLLGDHDPVDPAVDAGILFPRDQ